MAEKRCTITEEVKAFADDLFSYVWKKHRFNCESFEKMFAEKLSLEIEQSGAKSKSYFDEHIGNAILCSQYLLREFCCYFFTKIGKDLVKSRKFFQTFVYSVIFQWIRHRNDVFHKLLDSAAIIAEAILFCDAKENTAWDLNDAPEMFSTFFKCQLETDFFESGGWEKLEIQAFSEYMYLVILLQPSTYNMKLPYEKFKYTCSMISLLKSSQVRFPINDSYTCEECVSNLDRNVYHFSYIDSLHVRLNELSMDRYSTVAELLQNIELVVIELKNEKDEASSEDYVCRIVGKGNGASSRKDAETEDQEVLTESVTRKSKKKKKSKSKKSKSGN